MDPWTNIYIILNVLLNLKKSLPIRLPIFDTLFNGTISFFFISTKGSVQNNICSYFASLMQLLECYPPPPLYLKKEQKLFHQIPKILLMFYNSFFRIFVVIVASGHKTIMYLCGKATRKRFS